MTRDLIPITIITERGHSVPVSTSSIYPHQQQMSYTNNDGKKRYGTNHSLIDYQTKEYIYSLWHDSFSDDKNILRKEYDLFEKIKEILYREIGNCYEYETLSDGTRGKIIGQRRTQVFIKDVVEKAKKEIEDENNNNSN